MGTDQIEDNEIPVFLINGFLDSGKTSFINYTVSEDYFHIDGNTLLICSEEGETQYDAKILKREHTFLYTIDDEDQLTKEFIAELCEKHSCERVVIELNGMWDPIEVELPENFLLYQQITVMNGESLTTYLNNMKALMGPMLRNTELLLINRCDDISEETLLSWKRQLRPMLMQGAMIVMENKYGEVPLDTIPEDLPYDVNTDDIIIEPENYGIWFIDCRDYPERYEGKKITFTAQVMKHPEFPKDCFVPGRMAMTCCEADMAFLGYMAHYDKISAFADESWIRLTARMEMKELPQYEGEGPFLEVLKIAHTGEIKEPAGF